MKNPSLNNHLSTHNSWDKKGLHKIHEGAATLGCANQVPESQSEKPTPEAKNRRVGDRLGLQPFRTQRAHPGDNDSDVFLRAKEVATYTPKSPQRNPFILTALLTLVSLQEGLNIIEPLFLKEFLFGTRVRWTTHS